MFSPPLPRQLAPPARLVERRKLTQSDGHSSPTERPRKRHEAAFPQSPGILAERSFQGFTRSLDVWSQQPDNSGGLDSPQTLVGEPSPRVDPGGCKSDSIAESRSAQWVDSPRTLVEEHVTHVDQKLADLELEPRRPSGHPWSPTIGRISFISMPDVTEISGLEAGTRWIQQGRLVDTFTSQHMAQIQMEADLFSAIGCDKEAFELYTTLLKRYTLDNNFRDTSFWYYVIQCTHTAVNPAHLEIVQHIIHQELSLSEGSAVHENHPAKFLFHMLLAFTHGKVSAHDGIDQHVSQARTYMGDDPSRFSQMLQQLPPDDRSFDLAFYHHSLRVQSHEAPDLVSPIALSFSPFHATMASPRLESFIIRHKPGPFEPDGGPNPCLRSCLSWCAEKLSYLPFLPLIPGAESCCPNSTAAGWAESMALFFALWKHFVAESGTRQTNDTQVWIMETQRRMGISPTLLLMLVCRVIHDGYETGSIRTETEVMLLERLRGQAAYVLQGTSRHLARRFLRQYILHHSLTTQKKWQNQLRILARSHATACLEESFVVPIPRVDVPPSTEVDAMESPNSLCLMEGPSVALEAQQSPTLFDTPRWSGSSTANFRETSDRAATQVHNLGSISNPPVPSQHLRISGTGSLVSARWSGGSYIQKRESAESTQSFGQLWE